MGLGGRLRWGNPPFHISSHFILSRLHDKWGDSLKQLARSARPGNPLRLSQILPLKRFKAGNPPSRGRIRDT